MATQDGLSRFDGVRFRNYNLASSPGMNLSGSDVRDLLVDTVNQLIWALYSYGGFDAINYITGQVKFRFSQSNAADVKDLLLTSFCLINNQLLIGTSSGLCVFDIAAYTYRFVELTNNILNNSRKLWINKVVPDHAGLVWLLCNDDGVLVVNPETWTVQAGIKTETLLGNRGNSIYFFDGCSTADNIIFIGSNKGLSSLKLDGNEILLQSMPGLFQQHFNKTYVYACYAGTDNDTWIATENELIMYVPSEKKYKIVRENKSYDEENWIASVYAIFCDREKNLWLGCQQGMMFSNNRTTPFFSVSKTINQPFRINHTYGIFPESEQSIYVSAVNGLYHVIDSSDISQLSQNLTFFYVFRDPFGRILVSNLNGTFVLRDRQLIPVAKVYPEFSATGHLIINSHCVVEDSLLFMGTENMIGVIAWNFRDRSCSILNTSRQPALKENVVNTLFKDKTGRVWILSDNSVAIFDPKHKSVSFPGILNARTGKSCSIFFDAVSFRNHCYVASYGTGILKYDQNGHLQKVITPADGLCNSGVYKLLPYKDSLLFVTTNNGISLLDANDRIINSYYEKDGLQSDVFEERAGAVSDGLLYAGGVNGFTIINPMNIKAGRNPPSLLISGIKLVTTEGVYDTSNLDIAMYHIPDNWLQATVEFSGLDYENPQRVVYAYRIPERDTGWIETGNNNFVNLIGLPHGQYTVEVKAANEFRQWSDPKRLLLRIEPKWYQTIFFNVFLVFCIAGILYAFYRYRISQLNKQQQIRKAIASDLHDDIGSTLNSVKIFTHLAETAPDNRQYLQQIGDALKQASAGLRDMIWVLDDTHDTVEELVERLNQFAKPVTEASGILLRFDIDKSVAKTALGKTEKRNLLLIAKEAINNSIKYAACKNILVSFSRQHGKLTMTIRDDGNGFELNAITPGNGLRNMQERAQQIHYMLAIDAIEGNGTLITVAAK